MAYQKRKAESNTGWRSKWRLARRNAALPQPGARMGEAYINILNGFKCD
jgi:hypothetical protein